MTINDCLNLSRSDMVAKAKSDGAYDCSSSVSNIISLVDVKFLKSDVVVYGQLYYHLVYRETLNMAVFKVPCKSVLDVIKVVLSRPRNRGFRSVVTVGTGYVNIAYVSKSIKVN